MGNRAVDKAAQESGLPLRLTPPCPLIFLIGYRGTGKSTVARRLAERLSWQWLDMDEEIETQSGNSIKAIFAVEGEAGFRVRESALLEELCRQQQYIVATGGGVVLAEANRQRMRACGFVIWLTAGAETIYRRLQNDPSTAQRRPALTTGGLEEIRQLLQIREPLYRQCADLVIDANDRAPESIVDEIMRLCFGS